MGRKKLPKHVKDAAGTLRQDREVECVVYEPLSEIPDHPMFLKASGIRFWNIICQILISQRLLTMAFLLDIEGAAADYELYYEFVELKKAKQLSWIGVFMDGKKLREDYKLYKDSKANLNNFYTKYGLNLTASQTIKRELEIEDDELTKLINDNYER